MRLTVPPGQCGSLAAMIALKRLVALAELAEDAGLDVLRERRVGPGDEILQRGDQRRVLAGQPDGLLASRVDQPDAVVGEIGHLDDPRPRGCGQAGG